MTKRIRFHDADLETLRDSLRHYTNFLIEELTRHEESTIRFAQPDKWLQKREKLNYQLTNCKRIQNKIISNLEGLVGRTPESVENLLNITVEDKTGEYIKFFEAMRFIPFGDFEDSISKLLSAYQQGIVDGFVDSGEQLLKIRKLDAMRFAAYLEAHM